MKAQPPDDHIVFVIAEIDSVNFQTARNVHKEQPGFVLLMEEVVVVLFQVVTRAQETNSFVPHMVEVSVVLTKAAISLL